MKLFKMQGYDLWIDEIAYTLKPFKAIWDRDDSEGKYKAIQELAYIYFMEDPRSDYMSFMDPETRSKQIIQGQGMPAKWKPDKLVKDAQEFYASFKPESAFLLDDIKASIKVLRQGLITTEDLADVDIEKRANVLDKYATVISRLNKLARELDETERALATEISNADKARGSAEKAIFEEC